MTTIHEYIIVGVGKKSILQLLAEKTHKKESEIIKEGAEALGCPHEQFIWTSRYIECRELPARFILWAIDQFIPPKEAV